MAPRGFPNQYSNIEHCSVKPAGRRLLLEEVCLEGDKLTPEERERLVVVLEDHTDAFSHLERDYRLTTLTHEIPTGDTWPI